MLTIHDGIAVITLDNPPVNGLGHALRDRIVRQLEAAQADPTVRGIVLTGSDKAFSAGCRSQPLPSLAASRVNRT
jgi:3-hydroxyacyl-CoA dehydrogenase